MNESNFLKDLEYLVNIDSDSRNPEGIAKVAAFFKEKFESIGWQVIERNISDEAGPLLEITNRPSDIYDVLFMGHMDTVFPKGTVNERPYRVEGRRAYGPGVYDMKSGILLTYYICKDLTLDGSFCVLFNPDEEISSRYSRPYLEKRIRQSRYALVMEGGRSNGNLVNERKGIGKFKVELFGKAVHAGVEPEKGASAIHELLLRGQEILSWAKKELGTTINIGVITGGTVPNTVADYAAMEIDVRIKTLEEGERIEKAFSTLPNHIETAGVTLKVSGGIMRPPLFPTEKSLEFCKAIDEIKSNIGLDIGWTATGGGSDGNFSSALGVPTVDALGPVGGNGHAINEYMEIDSIQSRYQLVSEIIKHCVKKD